MALDHGLQGTGAKLCATLLLDLTLAIALSILWQPYCRTFPILIIHCLPLPLVSSEFMVELLSSESTVNAKHSSQIPMHSSYHPICLIVMASLCTVLSVAMHVHMLNSVLYCSPYLREHNYLLSNSLCSTDRKVYIVANMGLASVRYLSTWHRVSAIIVRSSVVHS